MARPRPQLHSQLARRTNRGALPAFDADARPLIRLQTLGAAVVMVGDVRLSAAAGTLFSVLVRLSGAPGMMLSRSVLRRSLWPDQEEVRQRANLRQSLYKLRSYGVRVSLHGDVVVLDESQVVRSFSLERSAETFERDVTLGHEPFGPFLPGFAVPWPEFQEWIDVQREAVHADVRRVLIAQMRGRRDRADWGGADALARWLLQFDPLNEEATLTVAECTALSGSKKEALAILDRYLAELGPLAGDIRLPASMLRKRIAEPSSRGRLSFAPTERHFVGRADELADLTLAMRRARWHDGGAVLLHGPPGIGKSRLAHELDKVATIEGVRVVQAACRESDLLRPLSVFLDSLPELLTCAGALGSAPESLAALRRLVPTERSAMHTEGVPVPAREPMPMASSLRRAIIDLLGAVSDEKPLLLIIEDVHWIDEHSWDVLSDLIERASAMRVFLLLTSREAHARPHRPQRVPLSLRVRAVPPLSPADCLLLSRAIGEDLSAPVNDEIGEWFVRASEGIPLFLRALVNHWIETGEAGGVPPTLVGVIEQRLSQLSGDALRVLQTVALLGKWATCERVMLMLGIDLNSIMSSMEELSHAGGLRTAQSQIIEVHDLLRQVALQSLTPGTRAFLRSRIATHLESAAVFPRLQCELDVVDHFSEALEQENAIRFALTAASTLMAMDAPHRALAVCVHAMDRMPALELDAPFSRLYRDALYSTGQYSRLLLDHSWNADVPASSCAWDQEHARDVVRMVEIADRGMYVGDFADLCGRGLLIAKDANTDSRLRVRASIAVVRAASMGVHRDLPMEAYATGRSVLVANPGCFEMPDELEMYFHTPFGSHERATIAARRLLSSASRRRTVSDKVRILGDCGYALMCAGELSEAVTVLKETQSESLRHDILTRASAAAFNRSAVALAVDDMHQANILARDGLTIARMRPDPFLESLAHRNLARLALLQGDPSSAESHYVAASQSRDVAAHPKWRAFDTALRLGLASSKRDHDEERQLLPLAIDELATHQGALGQDFLASRVVGALVSQDADLLAQEILAAYLNIHRKEAFPIPRFLRDLQLTVR